MPVGGSQIGFPIESLVESPIESLIGSQIESQVADPGEFES